MFNNLLRQMNRVSERDMEKKKKEDAQKEDTLKPITKVNSKLDKEMQEWEVESTTSGG
jgi:hypothetical protein